MKDSTGSVEVTFRIPGDWSNPLELVQRLPRGYRLTPEGLFLPDGTRIEFSPLPPDDQFPQIFRTSCRNPPRDEELAVVDRYTVNAGLIGPGGSLEAARTMMQAGAALVQAGGAGVFIDNCGLAHGAQNWLAMTEDGSPDAVSFAFVSVVRGKQEVWTMGMHVLGQPEIVMQRCDVEADDGDMIIDTLRYMARGEKPVGEGHVLILENGRSLQVVATTKSQFEAGSPMHNPFGRLLLLTSQDIAERN